MIKAELLVIINGGTASFFQKREQYELLILDGLSEFECSNFAKEIVALLERFADKLNLESVSELNISVLSTEERDVVPTVIQAIRDNTSCQNCVGLDCQHILMKVIDLLKNNEALEIDSFGINYNGINYKIVDDTLQTGPYNLLAYTVTGKLLLDHITD